MFVDLNMPPVSIFVALADPTRCRIIESLRQGPQPVHVLAAVFDISRPAISRHLRVLKHAKLISEKKIGRENLYRLHLKRLEPAQEWITTLLPSKLVKQSDLALIDTKPAAQPVKALSTRPKGPSISQMGFDF
jgi:DNA-binding transcriptional ArsR family regulator